jgi:hypothetical protein
MTRSGIVSLPAAAFVAGVVLGTACTPPIPTGKFHVLQQSSATVLATADGAYGRIGTLQSLRLVYRAATASGPLTRADFQPDAQDQKTDVAGRMRARRAALETLARYFAALDAFATRDFEGEVDAESQEFAGSVQALAAHGASDPGATKISSVLGTVVDVIGREIVRRRRLDGLERIMTTAQEPVEETCAFVASGSELASLATNVLVTNILAHANQLRPETRIGRLPVDEAVGQAVRDADTAVAALAAVRAAMQQLPAAHAEVRDSLSERVSPVEALRQLAAEAKRARQFQEELR